MITHVFLRAMVAPGTRTFMCPPRHNMCNMCCCGRGGLGCRGRGKGKRKRVLGVGEGSVGLKGGGVVGVCVGGGGWGVHINMLDFSEWGMVENI